MRFGNPARVVRLTLLYSLDVLEKTDEFAFVSQLVMAALTEEKKLFVLAADANQLSVGAGNFGACGGECSWEIGLLQWLSSRK